MSGRTKSGVFFAVIVLVATVVFWRNTERAPEDVDRIEPFRERPALADSDSHAPSEPSQANEHREWFPDLSDIEDVVDAGIDGTGRSFGCDMDRLRDRFSLLDTSPNDEGGRSRSELLSVLGASGDAELLLAASHLEYLAAVIQGGGGGPAEQRPSLERALAADPMNPAVLWDAAQLCGSEPELEMCQQSWLRANFETVLGGNGEYWAREAVIRYRAGDDQGALAAMRRASTAPEFENYVIEHTRILERALSAAPDIDYMERGLTAFAVSSGLFAAGNPGLMTACRTEAETNPEWRDACLDVASRYLADGRSLRSREVGARLQVSLYTQSGDVELRDAAMETRRWLDDAGLGDADDDVISVLLSEEDALRGFLDEYESSNELSAVEWLAEETARLKQNPSYTPCPQDNSVATE